MFGGQCCSPLPCYIVMGGIWSRNTDRNSILLQKNKPRYFLFCFIATPLYEDFYFGMHQSLTGITDHNKSSLGPCLPTRCTQVPCTTCTPAPCTSAPCTPVTCTSSTMHVSTVHTSNMHAQPRARQQRAHQHPQHRARQQRARTHLQSTSAPLLESGRGGNIAMAISAVKEVNSLLVFQMKRFL